MELYTGTAPSVTFTLPTSTTTISGVSYSVNGATPVAIAHTTTSGVSSAQLPYFQSEGSVVVNWGLTIPGSGSFTEPVTYDIVRPILPLNEVKTILETTDDVEAADVERAVRLIIQSHCGQKFGMISKTLTVEGHGDRVLRLPERLLQLTGISTLVAVLNIHEAIVVGDGWFLKKGWAEAVSTMTTDDLYFNGGGDVDSDSDEPGDPGFEQFDHGPVIRPSTISATPTRWQDDYPFQISGTWGYLTTPAAVQEAARLLVNDYACSEIAYRDRYLKDIKAADWEFEFSSRAWEYTGNVRADQLLSDYVIFDWAII